MNENLIPLLLLELRRRQEARNVNRQLRDSSNPFELPEETFRRMYRFSRESAMELFQDMVPFMRMSRRNTSIPNVIKFICALHFLSHGSYQKSVGKDYHCGLSQSSVSRCINEFVNIIVEHFAPQHIKFPMSLQEITNIKIGFFDKFQFPGIIGCIDCTHIALTPPPSDHAEYPGHLFINRKGFHSINCQLICDSNLYIRHINARYPGSVHDAAIWMLSNINHFLRQNYANNDHTTWLLGDSGYPLLPFLMTPIVGVIPGTPESRYTQGHATARNTVERCIGVLKAYFRCLSKDRVLYYKPPIAAKIIYTCAALHNMLRRRNDNLNIEPEVEDNINMNQNLDPDEPLLNEARNVRTRLVEQHFQ